MRPLTLLETARRVGRYVWSERQLFELLGGWVRSTADSEVKLLFAGQSSHHGWRAELWSAHLPQTAELARTELVAAPCPELSELFADLAATGDTLERLVATHRTFLPALISSYSEHLDRASAVADAAIARALRLVLVDVLDDWRAGERALRERLTSVELVRVAAAHQGRYDAALLTATARDTS